MEKETSTDLMLMPQVAGEEAGAPGGWGGGWGDRGPEERCPRSQTLCVLHRERSGGSIIPTNSFLRTFNFVISPWYLEVSKDVPVHSFSLQNDSKEKLTGCCCNTEGSEPSSRLLSGQRHFC